MAKKFQLQFLKGIAANIPAVLADAEFYLATDTGQLYVGLAGTNLPVGEPNMQVQGSNNNILQPNTDGSLNVSLGSAAGKVAVLKSNSLATTAVTPNQAILSYSVTAAKTLYLEYFDIQGGFTAISAVATVLGTVTITVGGTVVYTGRFVNPTTSDGGSQAIRISVGEPIPLAAGTAIVVQVTPATATSVTWVANLGGYEK